MEEFLLIGMIHLPRLTFDDKTPMKTIIRFAVDEMKTLESAGFPAVMVENFGDAPFPKTRVSDTVLGKMSVILHELRKESSLDIGVNVLRNACGQAMSLATLHGCQYIRCNIWESAYVTDQGIIEGAAHTVTDLKNRLQSEVKVLADVHVKHARPMGEDSIVEAARNALGRGGAYRVVVSGAATGSEPPLNKIEELNGAGIKPVIGSGASIENIELFQERVSGFIVGTSIKRGGITTNSVDPQKAKEFVDKLGI